MSDQCWVRRSLSAIRQGLIQIGHMLSPNTIRRLLSHHKIRPKSHCKRLKTTPHPQRDEQFRYIQRQREAFELMQQPIISVDTKKKELIGNFAQAGQVWCEQADSVLMYDFASDAEGKAVPHGSYDIQANRGYVCVGQSADTPTFAVDNIVEWWEQEGYDRYPNRTDLLILADGGGSNSSRSRVFKQQLQLKLADVWNLVVTVAHYPPGASKWNPIEHRLFSHISQTWAGTALTSFEHVVGAIRQTTTQTGLQVQASLVTQHYPTGVKVSDQEMNALNLLRHTICPDWNYTIFPRRTVSYF